MQLGIPRRLITSFALHKIYWLWKCYYNFYWRRQKQLLYAPSWFTEQAKIFASVMHIHISWLPIVWSADCHSAVHNVYCNVCIQSTIHLYSLGNPLVSQTHQTVDYFKNCLIWATLMAWIIWLRVTGHPCWLEYTNGTHFACVYHPTLSALVMQ